MATKKRKTPPDEEEVADTGDFRSMVNLVQLREVPEQIATNRLTFSHRNDLVEVELCDGLEKIIDEAFRYAYNSVLFQSYWQGCLPLVRKTDESRTA